MADLRTLLAAVLGVGLGAVLVAYPDVVIRAQTAGRLPHDRGGEYGDSAAPGRWRLVVRALGVAAILAGAYFGWVALG
ncbi:MAG: hypothetical protein ABEI39_04395 [Halobacteriales archaeon]